MGILGQILGTAGDQKKFSAKPLGKFNFYDYHSHNDLKIGLMKFKPEERRQIIDTLKEKHLWGSPVTSQKVLMAVQDKLGVSMAKKVQSLVLTRYLQSTLTPEQIKRNVTLTRFERSRDEPGRRSSEEPNYSAGPLVKHSVSISSVEAQGDNGEHQGFVNKRPISFQ